MTDPAPIPNARPFDLFADHISGLYDEAKNFCDGEPIATQEQADAVQTLLRQIQEAHKGADAERVKENKPFDDGKAEVQARYAPLISDTKAVKGKTVLATDFCKRALQPWLKKLADQQEAEARAAREAAAAAAVKAAEAIRQANETGNLTAREEAEQVVKTAKYAEQDAKAAEKARPQASGYGRAATLRTSYKPVLTDVRAACRHFFTIDPDAFNAVVQKLAEDQVAAGRRGDQIPGFVVVEEQSVV